MDPTTSTTKPEGEPAVPAVATASTEASVVPPAAPASDSAASSGPTGAKDAIEDISHQFAQQATIFGGKSLDELHRIQERASHLSAGILFSDPSLHIPRPILDALTVHMRFERPSQIQASTLPLILDHRNVIAQAQSGAGKTIAFVIGMLAKVDMKYNITQAVCLSPVRELVNQVISDAIIPLSVNMPGLRYEAAVPGNNPRGPVCESHIVVGTPGTMKRWVDDSYLRMNYIKVFVVDEADHMVHDKSLGKETLYFKSQLDPRAQILMFSATFSKIVLDYARKMVKDAYVIQPRSREELVLDVIFQVKINVAKVPGGKLQVLKDIYDYMTMQQSIVFVETKEGANRVAQFMTESGLTVSVLHSDLRGPDRDRVMADFRSGATKVLITTNVLARGVDVPAVAVVVNYDLPMRRKGQRIEADPATYLHRIGRSGRFGRKGTAISFYETAQDAALLREIELHYLSSGQAMLTEWDASDIDGLTRAVDERPAGGEILPEAVLGTSVAAPSDSASSAAEAGEGGGAAAAGSEVVATSITLLSS
jgi:ATP-dependent RNA helicase DDX19/DBP5